MIEPVKNEPGSQSSTQLRPDVIAAFAPQSVAGFTLIELMVVIGIMGIVLAMAIPSIYRVFHKELLAKTLSEVRDVCLTARQQAIMQGRMAEIIFHAKDGSLEVLGGAAGRAEDENHPAPAGQPDRKSVV